MSEVETALEEIIEKEDASEEDQGCESEGKRKRRQQDRENTQDIRRKAMERLGKTQVKEESNRKRRSNGSDTLAYSREKNETLQEIRKEDLDLKKKEIEQDKKKHGDFMNVILQQQQQQHLKQMQDFQAMMSKFSLK